MDLSGTGSGEEPPGTRELRRSYHDRLSEVSESSRQIVAASVAALGEATRAVMGGDLDSARRVDVRFSAMAGVAKNVDQAVLDLLALESPVARDLRLLIASRDVTQIGMLTLGLCVALAGRAPSVAPVLDGDIRPVLEVTDGATAALLGKAGQAWVGVDSELAGEVVHDAVEVRVVQLELLAALLRLRDVPMEAALDLGMVSRAYERIADHAVEIAQQVVFAAG